MTHRTTIQGKRQSQVKYKEVLPKEPLLEVSHGWDLNLCLLHGEQKSYHYTIQLLWNTQFCT